MSSEKQLLEALQRIATERSLQLNFGPLVDLVIPVKGDKELRISMIFLTMVGE
jgi:hypothetical protein